MRAKEAVVSIIEAGDYVLQELGELGLSIMPEKPKKRQKRLWKVCCQPAYSDPCLKAFLSSVCPDVSAPSLCFVGASPSCRVNATSDFTGAAPCRKLVRFMQH